jgi:hypothetical protein
MEKKGLGKGFEYCFCMENFRKNEGERSCMEIYIYIYIYIARRCVKVERLVVS